MSSSAGAALLLLSVVALAGEATIALVAGPGSLAAVVVLALAALLGVALGGARCRPPTWAIVLSGVLTVRALATGPPWGNVVSDSRLLTGIIVIGVVSAVAALLSVVRTASAGQVAAGALVTTAAGYGLVVLGSRPVIDVHALLQGAGRGLAAGQNPYELAFPAAPPGQVDDCFTYLPGTALLTAPGVWLGGDARWAELVLLLAAAALLIRQVWTRGGARLGLALLAVLVPGTVRVVQQSWTEPLLLALLVAVAVLIDRGRFAGAAAVFGLALATKQHVVLLVPLLLLAWPPRPCRARLRDLSIVAAVAAAVTLPFLLANPARFTTCTVDFFLDAPAPPSSFSLWLHVPPALQLPLLAVALLGGYVLGWRCCPRTGSGLLLASAVVFTTVGLVNKQTFLNQWWLVAALAVAGLALAGRPPPRRSG